MFASMTLAVALGYDAGLEHPRKWLVDMHRPAHDAQQESLIENHAQQASGPEA